jgi:hypothetical protein
MAARGSKAEPDTATPPGTDLACCNPGFNYAAGMVACLSAYPK